LPSSAGNVNPEHVLGVVSLAAEPALRRESTPRTLAAVRPPPIDRRAIAAERVVNFSEDNPKSLFFINGQLWNPSAPPMFVAHTGTVEEWTIRNFAHELHVFHIHQIHFLVEDIDGVPQPPNTWRDSLAIPWRTGNGAPGVAHVVMDFRDPVIAGTFVFHCHILEHEDGGMMAKIQLVDGRANAAAPNPFARFIDASLAFVRSLRGGFGDEALLANLNHICGKRDAVPYSTGPLSEGFVRDAAVTEASRLAAHPEGKARAGDRSRPGGTQS
jgi:hypothetical protein